MGKKKVDLIDPLVASILEPTLRYHALSRAGHANCSNYAGFTLGKADLLRRAMSKKKVDDMQNGSDS